MKNKIDALNLTMFIFFLKYKRALLEEYAIICRSLMRWLRDSISTMDNRTVPNNIIEIKALLNDVKSFRLEEYATRLKEKKKLLNLYDEIMVIRCFLLFSKHYS